MYFVFAMATRKGLSLSVRIPLLTSLLLAAALAAMTVASYLELRRALVDEASQRLQGAAAQVAGMFGTSAGQRVAAMQQFMRQPEVAAYLQTRDPAHRAAVEDSAKNISAARSSSATSSCGIPPANASSPQDRRSPS